MDKYQKLDKIGEGAYGKVYKARDKTNGQLVALKKCRANLHEEGIPPSSLREISLLKLLCNSSYVARLVLASSPPQNLWLCIGSIISVQFFRAFEYWLLNVWILICDLIEEYHFYWYFYHFHRILNVDEFNIFCMEFNECLRFGTKCPYSVHSFCHSFFILSLLERFIFL